MLSRQRVRPRALVLAVLFATPACGEDSEDPVASTGTSLSQTGGSADGGSTTAADGDDGSTNDGSTNDGSADDESTDGGSASEGSSDDDSGATTGGAMGDPAYPRPDGMRCPGGLAPLTLPGGSVCAPFCTGEGDPCPSAATGDAAATCTPFEEPGGSGTPCMDSSRCPDGEDCGVDGTCIAVAFWACRLQCDGGQTCPDTMACGAIGSCAYP